MRRVSLLLIWLSLLIAQPAVAKDLDKTSPMFGRAYCKPSFPCTDTSSSEAARIVGDKLATVAERCLYSSLGMRSPPEGGYFERSFGLDSSLCLTAKELPKAAQGISMVPQCCVQPIDDTGKTCQLVCTKFGVR